MRRIHCVAISVVAIVALTVVPVGPSAHAVADPTGAEARLLQLINTSRAQSGRGPLVSEPALVSLARSWSTKMRANGTLSHNPNIGAEATAYVTSYWTRVGQNVGKGQSADGLFQSFWNSAPHRDNFLGDYDLIGLGIVADGAGNLWVTINFLGVPAAVSAVSIRSASSSGYWVTTGHGAVLAYCGAGRYGSTGGMRLARPVVGMTSTPLGGGYWLVASDGGIFSFGDAKFYGSTGGMRLARPVVGMSATGSGGGYWMVASDGGIFSFGDAGFLGSAVGRGMIFPATGIGATSSARGYRVLSADGSVYAFGDATVASASGSC